MKIHDIAVCAAFLGISAAGASAAPCWDPSDPSIVLRCFEQAAAAADLEAVKRVLAEDYVRLIHRQSGKVVEVARNDEIRSWRKLFVAGGKPHLVYKDGYKVVKGTDAGTWRIDGASWQNDIEFVQKNEPITRKTTSALDTTVFVRMVAEPEPHYVIWRIEEPAAKK